MTKVPSIGPGGARIMVVGEAPGRQEEAAGEPFVGRAGGIFKDMMLEAGINPRDVYFTNLSKYRPPGNELTAWFHPKTGMPEHDLLIEGLRELRDEIAAVNPNVIISLGSDPLAMLTGKGRWNPRKQDGKVTGHTGIGDWRGSIIEGVGIARGRKIVATYHPAAIDRKWSWRVLSLLDLQRAREQARFPDIRRPVKEIVIDPQGAERLEWRARLLADPKNLLAIDIEYIKDRLLCVGFSADKDSAVVIPTTRASDFEFVRSILESGQPLAAQNGMFDFSILDYWFKIRCWNFFKHDTMLAHHAAYVEQPKDLGTLCSIYTEQPCYWTEIDWKKIKAGTQPISDVYGYNAIDAWVTKDVAEQQLADELLDPAIRARFDRAMGLNLPLWEMSKRGVPIDRERLRILTEKTTAEYLEGMDMLEAVYGGEFNISSPKQMAELLFSKLGMPKQGMNKTGPAVDDKTLAKLMILAESRNKTAWVKLLSLLRKTKKARSLKEKFCEIEFDADNRARSMYKIGGTTTFRLSSSKFYPTNTGDNQQNRPRNKDVRKVFRPDKGYVFFYNDLERAESLVVAHLTGSQRMLDHHAPGADAHRLLASDLFSAGRGRYVDPAEITDDERYIGKQTRHAGNYMEGWKTFMDNVNKYAEETGVAIDAPQAKMLIGLYRELHPELPAWWNSVEIQLRNTRKLYNLLGAPRTFYDRVSNNLPAGVAFIPQSTVGEVLNVGLRRVWEDIQAGELREYGVQLLLQIHDALGGQIKEQYVEPAMRRIGELMRVPLVNPRTRETFEIPVELTVSDDSWGACKLWRPAA